MSIEQLGEIFNNLIRIHKGSRMQIIGNPRRMCWLEIKTEVIPKYREILNRRYLDKRKRAKALSGMIIGIARVRSKYIG